ncbi:MAG: TfuA-like protein [Pseudomonadota bacterium]
MSVLVFVGPTLTRDEVAEVLDAVCLPPVAQGDLYRALERQPATIGIVDGYFHGVPSVWHKEILWAISQGVPVFGAASMGALRAAELAQFGMIGIGRIFEGYRDGILEDDDEVAVLHGPEELGFTALSEPLVNIRATLEKAQSEGLVGEETARSLLEMAKATYFPERSWEKLLAASADLPGAARLEAWLAEGRVDQKRLDALEMLAAMAKGAEATPADFDFERTQLWERSTVRWLRASGGAPNDDQAVLDELRLDGERHQEIRHAAILRLLALKEAARDGVPIERQAHRSKLSDYRAALGLYQRGDLDAWLAENGLDAETLEQLMADELRIDRAIALDRHAIEGQMLAVLQLSGTYADLARRAGEKSAALATQGKSEPEDTGLDKKALIDWFLAQMPPETRPEDAEGWLEETGLDSLDELTRLLAREFLFLNS